MIPCYGKPQWRVDIENTRSHAHAHTHTHTHTRARVRARMHTTMYDTNNRRWLKRNAHQTITIADDSNAVAQTFSSNIAGITQMHRKQTFHTTEVCESECRYQRTDNAQSQLGASNTERALVALLPRTYTQTIAGDIQK